MIQRHELTYDHCMKHFVLEPDPDGEWCRYEPRFDGAPQKMPDCPICGLDELYFLNSKVRCYVCGELPGTVPIKPQLSREDVDLIEWAYLHTKSLFPPDSDTNNVFARFPKLTQLHQLITRLRESVSQEKRT